MMGEIKVTWSDSGPSSQQTIDTRTGNSGHHLYMYLDESGNLDFKKSGTPFFIMTCAVAKRPFAFCDALREFRYDLWEKGFDIEKFHACEDDRDVRREVYSMLSEMTDGYRVYSVYVDKPSVPDEMRTADAVYSKVFKLLIDEIYRSEHLPFVDGVIVVTDKLPKDAERRQVAKPLKKYMKEKFQDRHIPYRLLHHDSASDMNLQVADYFCWAAQRDLAQGKTWPMNLVFDKFARVGQVSFK